MSFVRAHRLDLAGALAAFVLGLPSLAYRYGPDQAMFHYVAREWLDGRLPYRDVFDVKPPGIFVLEAILLALFGESEVVLRIAALAAVMAVGALAALALDRRRPGELGLGIFLSVAWHYGAFDFYHSAQTELFQTLFLVLGLVLSQRRRDVLAGASLGVAVLFKLTAAVPALGIVLFALRSGPRALRFGKLTLSGALPLVCFVLGYALVDVFGTGGALASLADYVTIVAHYGTSAKPSLLARFGTFWLENAAWLLVALGSAGLAVRELDRAERVPLVGALALFLLAAGAVLSQGKLSAYQWDVTSAFLVLVLLHGLRVAPPRVIVAAALVLAALPFVRPGAFYGTHVRTLVTGGSVSAAMEHPDFLYAYDEQRRMAELVAARDPSPTDLLHVRGYEPTVYVLTGLRSPARFFENHLHSWWVRDYDALEAAKQDHYDRLAEAAPRFFATRPEMPIDVEVLERAGYERFGEVGRFTLWERTRTGAPKPRWPAGWWREPERRARERGAP